MSFGAYCNYMGIKLNNQKNKLNTKKVAKQIYVM